MNSFSLSTSRSSTTPAVVTGHGYALNTPETSTPMMQTTFAFGLKATGTVKSLAPPASSAVFSYAPLRKALAPSCSCRTSGASHSASGLRLALTVSSFVHAPTPDPYVLIQTSSAVNRASIVVRREPKIAWTGGVLAGLEGVSAGAGEEARTGGLAHHCRAAPRTGLCPRPCNSTGSTAGRIPCLPGTAGPCWVHQQPQGRP